MLIRKKAETLIVIAIICLPLSLAIEMNTSFLIAGYVDEIITLFMLFHVGLLALSNQLDRADLYLILLLFVFSFIGLISNMSSGVVRDIKSIFLDAFAQYKIFVGFLSAKYVAKKCNDNYIFMSLEKIAKISLILGSICGLISIFVDIGMAEYSTEQRYGLPAYYFVFGNSGRYGIIVAVMLLIVEKTTENRKTILGYEILAIICMLLTTKGTVYVIIVVYICLQILFRALEKEGRFTLKTALPTVIAGIGASGYQISSYLLNEEAPRALLIKYGFITANRFFPFGSGFATYGSAEAAKDYSPLYREYGWANKWTMGIENGTALNDNYLATIVGETGYFGLLIFLLMFFNIYRQVNIIISDIKSKALILGLFFDMIVSFIATGITKSSIGMMVFITLGVCVGLSEKEKRR